MHLAPPSPLCRVRAVLGGTVIVLATALVGAPPASAHTDVEYTVPADQEQVAEPVEQITVAFGDPVTLVGAGFEVFTPQEVVVEPSVFTEDNMVFVLQLDQPLAGGEAGVRYEVNAADGHVLEGGFRFTVPAIANGASPTTVPSTAASASTLVAVADDADDGGGSSTGLIIGVIAALAVGAAAVVVLRARAARAS